MSLQFEILSPEDRPALVGVSSSDLVTIAHSVLSELGFKVHLAETHEDFVARFGQFQYEVVVIEDSFGGVLPEQNEALTTLRNMPMNQRRHATIFLLGDLFESMNPMQAFQQSVHAVVNRGDMDKFNLIALQIIGETSAFLNVYRDVQGRLAEGKR